MAKRAISIIIPTRNRSNILHDCLELVEKQIKRLNGEIILVDDGSDGVELKKIRDYKKKYKNLSMVEEDHNGPAAARNIGIRMAEGNIIVFINDDTLISEKFIDKHLKFHEKHKGLNESVVGPFIEQSELVNTPIMKWLVKDSGMHFKYEKSKNGQLPWYYFWTCNVSVKRDFLIDNNLFFDESFPTAAWEDVEFGYRAKLAGLRVYFNKSLVAYHCHSFELNDVLQRFYSHGRGMYHLVGKLPKKDLPMLAKTEYRMLANLVLGVTMYPLVSKILKNIISLSDKPSNLLLYYLIVGEKINGWKYENEKDKSMSNLSRN